MASIAAARSTPIAGLYAVTPDEPDDERLAAMVGAALDGGARIVQYRNKAASIRDRSRQAHRLAWLCAAHDALLVVNDHADLALEIDGAGLHVGRDDANDLTALRARVGARVIGVSCYADLDRARAAAHQGADYLAFGSVHPSSTKPAAVRAPLDLFGRARALGVPTVAIGGVDADNLPALIAAGADAAAIITALFEGRDPPTIRARARRLAGLFAQHAPPTETIQSR